MKGKAAVKIQGGRPHRKPRGGQAQDRINDLHQSIPRTANIDVGDELDDSGVEDISDIGNFTHGRVDIEKTGF